MDKTQDKFFTGVEKVNFPSPISLAIKEIPVYPTIYQ